MKSKYETLLSVIEYVKKESENPIDELLMMGFTPCQLVREFGFDEKDVKTSELFVDIEDGLDEKLDETEYPFVLDGYNDFDAALLSRFELSSEDVAGIKKTDAYFEMLDTFKELKVSALTDVMNEVFDRYENSLLFEKESGTFAIVGFDRDNDLYEIIATHDDLEYLKTRGEAIATLQKETDSLRSKTTNEPFDWFEICKTEDADYPNHYYWASYTLPKQLENMLASAKKKADEKGGAKTEKEQERG